MESSQENRPTSSTNSPATIRASSRNTPTLPPETLSVGSEDAAEAGALTLSEVLPGMPVIPGYRIVREIATGGMGRIYAAIDATLEREVAIKILLPGADSERFLTEARITARLPHPAIPPVYAIGHLPDGTPWLAMKLIHGQTLARLLQRRRCISAANVATAANQSLEKQPVDFLRLLHIFEQVCQAVGFAHSRGIIHRDLKPPNIMVGEFGEVQVMDWGLAKQLSRDARLSPDNSTAEQAGTEALRAIVDSSASEALASSLLAEQDLTQTGAILGTPGYMAPEQARGQAADARSDVFALGSILAVILTGKPAVVGSSSLEVIQKSAMADLEDVHSRLDSCGADPELVELCKRCLAANPADRPADGQQVAIELAAYHAGVQTRLRQAEMERLRAATQAAEQRKRRRVVMWSATGIAGILASGLGLSLWQMIRAWQAEARAHTNELRALQERDWKEQERLRAEYLQRQAQWERDRANRERASAVAVRDFLRHDLLQLANARRMALRLQRLPASGEVKHDIAVRELVDLAAQEFAPERIAHRFPGQAEVQAEILQTISEVYTALGEYKQAIAFGRASVQQLQQALGPSHPATLACQINLFHTLVVATQYREAVPVLMQVLAELEKLLATAGPPSADNPADVAFEAVWNALKPCLDARTLTVQRLELGVADGVPVFLQLSLGLARIERLARLCLERYGSADPRAFFPRLLQAMAYHALAQVQLAVPLYETLVRELEQLVQTGADTHATILLTVRYMLLLAYDHQGKNKIELISLVEQLREDAQRLLGPDHPSTLQVIRFLANKYHQIQRYDQAIALYEQTRRLLSERLGPAHPETLYLMDQLSHSYWAAGKTDQALSLWQQTLAQMQARLGPEHPYTLSTLNHLAHGYCCTGRLTEGLTLLLEIYQARCRKLGFFDPETLQTMQSLVDVARTAGQPAIVLPVLEQAACVAAQRQFRDHQAEQVIRVVIAAYEADREWTAAESWRRCWLSHLQQRYGLRHPACARELVELATNLTQQQKWVEAEAALHDCLAIRLQHEPESWTTFHTQVLLGEIVLAQALLYPDAQTRASLLATAETLLLKGYDGLKQRSDQLPPERIAPLLSDAAKHLMQLYEAMDNKEQAHWWRRQASTQQQTAGPK